MWLRKLKFRVNYNKWTRRIFHAVVTGSRVSLSLVTALVMLWVPFIVVDPNFIGYSRFLSSEMLTPITYSTWTSNLQNIVWAESGGSKRAFMVKSIRFNGSLKMCKGAFCTQPWLVFMPMCVCVGGGRVVRFDRPPFSYGRTHLLQWRRLLFAQALVSGANVHLYHVNCRACHLENCWPFVSEKWIFKFPSMIGYEHRVMCYQWG